MNSFKKQVFIQLAISLVILAALVGGLVFFKSNIKDYSSRIKQGRKELFERSSALSSLANIRSQYETKAKNYLSLIYNIIPQRDQLINLPRDLRTIAKEVDSFGFDIVKETAPTAGSLGVISFNVTIQAPLSSVTEFIRNLESFKYLVVVDSLNLERQKGEVFQASLKGRVFFRQ
mgnify:CR=1 FL=1